MHCAQRHQRMEDTCGSGRGLIATRRSCWSEVFRTLWSHLVRKIGYSLNCWPPTKGLMALRSGLMNEPLVSLNSAGYSTLIPEARKLGGVTYCCWRSPTVATGIGSFQTQDPTKAALLTTTCRGPKYRTTTVYRGHYITHPNNAPLQQKSLKLPYMCIV